MWLSLLGAVPAAEVMAILIRPRFHFRGDATNCRRIERAGSGRVLYFRLLLEQFGVNSTEKLASASALQIRRDGKVVHEIPSRLPWSPSPSLDFSARPVPRAAFVDLCFVHEQSPDRLQILAEDCAAHGPETLPGIYSFDVEAVCGWASKASARVDIEFDGKRWRRTRVCGFKNRSKWFRVF